MAYRLRDNKPIPKKKKKKKKEAEYISLSDTSCQLVWVRNLFSELGIELAPILLFGDD
jgi:hypothetical protein